MTRATKDEWAIQLALVTAQRSTCCRRQVGAVLTDSAGHVLATGYNGVAAGLPHCNELRSETVSVRRFMGQEKRVSVVDPADPASYPNACAGAFSPSGTNLDGCEAIHAEQNALLQCRDVRDIHTCYTTTAPCITCAKLLLNTACQRIVYLDEYPHAAARELWERTGREWVQLVVKD